MGAADVHRALLGRDVAHEVVRLRRPVSSADDLPAALGLPAARCVAVRCYVADRPGGAAPGSGPVVAVLVHAGEVPDPVALLDALGARSVRAATAAEVNAATDCAVGLVSPAALSPDVQVLADAALADGAHDVVYTAAAEGGVALGIRAVDLLATAGARLVPLSGRPLPPVERGRYDGVLDLDAAAGGAGAPPVLAPVVDLDAHSRERRGTV